MGNGFISTPCSLRTKNQCSYCRLAPTLASHTTRTQPAAFDGRHRRPLKPQPLLTVHLEIYALDLIKH